MKMHPVPSGRLDAVWGKIAPHLRKFRNKYPDSASLGEVYDLASEGKRQVYIVADGVDVKAVIITAVSGDVMEVPIVAGSGAVDWAAGVLWNLEEMARSNGIETLRLYPRPGWSKLLNLAPSEWRKQTEIYERRL